MKNILVPTDFSTCANNAVNFAVQTAKYLPVKIILLHSFELNDSMYTNYVGLDKEYSRMLLHDLNEKMKTLANDIQQKDGITADIIVCNAPLEEAVASICAEQDIDMVVMGTLGATGLREIFWGSTTASLIEKTTVPLMVIPHEYYWKKPEKFLLATNHFEKDTRILNYLFEMVKMYGGTMKVATFIDEQESDSADHSAQVKKMQEYEAALKEMYGNEAPTATNLYGTAFEDSLHHYIKEHAVDVLAMITYYQKKGFFYRLFNTSITKKMSYHTDIPLLVIPGNEKK